MDFGFILHLPNIEFTFEVLMFALTRKWRYPENKKARSNHRAFFPKILNRFYFVKVRMKVVPSPLRLLTFTSQLFNSQKPFTTDKPKPVPSYLLLYPSSS